VQAGRFRDIWRNLEPRGQLTIVGAALAVVVLAFVLFRFASKPSYTALATGLDPADAAEVANALDAQGIGYRLVNGGTEVDVIQGQASKAKVALAAQNLPRGGHVGFEIFDKQALGATDFQQKVNFQRALEGEIARTIEGMDGIANADVQLVLPQDTLFADEGTKASAAVMLTTSGLLDAAAVKSIAHLVGSSVEGLQPQNVTITDNSGSLLWPTAESGVSAGTKLEAEQQYAAQVSAQANAFLAATLGPDKAQARVHAVLDVDQTTQDSVTYAQKGTPLQTQSETEKLTSQGSSPAGAAGTATNIPGYAQTATGSGTSNYQSRKSTTQYGVNKTVTRVVKAPGTVQRLDVAILFDESVPAAQQVDLRNAVAAMVGLDPKRGDTIETAALKFAPAPKDEAAKAGPAALLANPLGLLKYVVIGLGSIVFLFLMRRSLKKREGEGIAPEPTWLRQIEGAVSIAQLGPGGSAAVERLPDPVREQRELAKTEVEEIVKKEPDRVAAQVGKWLKE
jgi:flagellar M-ring protein FliF